MAKQAKSPQGDTPLPLDRHRGRFASWEDMRAEMYSNTMLHRVRYEQFPLTGDVPSSVYQNVSSPGIEIISDPDLGSSAWREVKPERFDVPSLTLVRHKSNSPAYRLDYHALHAVLDKATTEAYFIGMAERMLRPTGNVDRSKVETALLLAWTRSAEEGMQGSFTMPEAVWLDSPQAIAREMSARKSDRWEIANLLEGIPGYSEFNSRVRVYIRALAPLLARLEIGNPDKFITPATLGRVILYDLVRFIGEVVPDRYLALAYLAQHTGLIVPTKDAIFVCEPPRHVAFDARGRLHHADRASIEYADGSGFFIWHSVSVPDFVIAAPQTITLEHIDSETNAEVRRVMIEQYGAARYMMEVGAEMRASDSFGKVWVKEFGRAQEPLVIVEVLNSTPEGEWRDTGLTETINISGVEWTRPVREFIPQLGDDGKPYHKTYYLRVDPRAYRGKTQSVPQAAVASTWRIKETGELVFPDFRSYLPDFES